MLSSRTSLKASHNLHCKPQFSFLLHTAEVWTLISCLDYLYLCDIAIFVAIVLCAGEFYLYQFSCLLHAAELSLLLSSFVQTIPCALLELEPSHVVSCHWCSCLVVAWHLPRTLLDAPHCHQGLEQSINHNMTMALSYDPWEYPRIGTNLCEPIPHQS